MAVCTNCVAPIARGLYAAGMSRESVLAAIFASPALNVVVLAMTFALFPEKVALLKLATVLFLILCLHRRRLRARKKKRIAARSTFQSRKAGGRRSSVLCGRMQKVFGMYSAWHFR